MGECDPWILFFFFFLKIHIADKYDRVQRSLGVGFGRRRQLVIVCHCGL